LPPFPNSSQDAIFNNPAPSAPQPAPAPIQPAPSSGDMNQLQGTIDLSNNGGQGV